MSTKPPAGAGLPDRYGRPRPWTRPAVWLLVAVLVLLGVGWTVWAATDHATPVVSSRLIAYDVISPRRVEVVVQVDHLAGLPATCRVRALGRGFAVVGETTFAVAGSSPPTVYRTALIRTASPAMNGELVGCTAPGQPQPR